MPVEPLANARHEAFAQHLAKGASQTEAYLSAGYKDSPAARANAARLIANDSIRARVEHLKNQAAERAIVTHGEVLRRLHAIAFADPNEFARIRVSACRHCWGRDHQHQWANPAEYERDHTAWQVAYDKALDADPPRQPPPEPSDAGGYGYSHGLLPNSECPVCLGDGLTEVILADTTKVSEQAKALYAGAKHGKYGIEVQTLDRFRALEMLGKHLGLFTEKVDVTSGGKPIVLGLEIVPPDGYSDST